MPASGGVKMLYTPNRSLWAGFAFRTLLVCGLAVLLAGSAWSQTLYGNLIGNVSDASNAAVASATIRIRNVDNGITRSATSDESGNYQFTDLPPGNYDISISAAAFGERTTRGVAVGANQTKRVDATLTVGAVSESVDVSTAPPALQTDRADVNYEITQTQVAQLPTTGSAGRNFQNLYKLIPGVPPPTENNSQAGNPGRTQAVTANGVSNTINSTKIDGAAVGYPWLQSIVAYIPPTDSIESANIVTNSFNAEQGSAGGVAANLIVKSGTNRFHGGAWEYNSISQFNARQYFVRPTAAQPNPPKNIYNEYGANIGGPIKKDKLFFFFGYNRTSLRQFKSGPNTYNVPLARFRGGDFSSIASGANFGGTAFSAAQTAIYDPTTGDANGNNRTPFPNNIIPANRLSPAAVKLLALVPNETVANSIANNYVNGAVLAYDRGTYDTKINYNPTDKTTFFGRYSLQRSLIIDPPALGAAISNTWDGGQPGTAPGTVQNIGLGATHTFSPNFLVDANAGFVRINLAARAPDYGTNYGLDTLQIPGTNGTTAFESGIPVFNLSNGASNLGNAIQSNPFQFRDMQYVGNLNATWVRGSHTFRFGGEYTHSAINHLQTNGASPRGQFAFSGGATGINNGSSSGNPNYFRTIADLLLGMPQSVGKTVQVFQPNGPRFSSFGFFAQDTWKATQNLTINYGVRYEFYPFANRDHTGVFRFDPTSRNVLIGGRGNTPTDTGEDVGHGQIVPRLGVNYRINDKTVIRSGFGMTVDPENFRFFRDSYPALITLNNVGATTYLPAGALNTASASAPNANTLPGGALTVGIPTVQVPDISSGVVPLPYNYTTQTAPQKWRRGYIESWNLFIDRDLARGIVLNVGYVGTHHVRHVVGLDINSGSVSSLGTDSRVLFTDPNAPGNVTPGTPRKFSGQILQAQPYGDEEYSALQTQITNRQLKQIQFGYAYTWSHYLNNYDSDSTFGAMTFNSPNYIKRNFGNSQFDRKHINALWTVWQIPVGPGRRFLHSGIVGRIVGGFDLTSVTTYYSGRPFQLTDSSQNGNGDTAVPYQLSKLALTGTHYTSASNQTPYYFENKNNILKIGDAVAQRFLPTLQNGNVGRNTYRGPGYFNMDFSLTRNIPVYREFNIILKAESFDVTNTPQWGQPVSNVNDAAFGRITSVLQNSNRTIRFSGRFQF